MLVAVLAFLMVGILAEQLVGQKDALAADAMVVLKDDILVEEKAGEKDSTSAALMAFEKGAS